ncbi:Hypothetical predicted protein [Mytilus galloprovincialis]|uniref:PH domain-containing protein n=1 Tax=Mytilus galloprovincialis TaxID=29158 RepID=A0A8B6EBP5_MYTGA|nr:Hypothetical predicted protein [Mytilus galloprovincialis]
MEGILKKKVSIMRGFEDKWFKLTENGFLEYYEIKPSTISQDTDVPANQIPSCVSGFGMKAGGLFDTSWYRRYFVLSDREFQFFLSETETTPQRTVPIEDIKGVANYSGYTGKQTVFQLVTKHKTFYIEVETQLELDKWTKELSYCLRKIEQIWLNPDLRVLKGKFYIGLARIAPDRDDCTFRIITNSGAKHILRSSQLTDRQKWIDTILETQNRVKKDMGPIVRKFSYKGAKHSAKESSSKEDKKDSSFARSHSVWFGGALGELAHHTMTVFDETEDTNTYSKQNWYIAIELMWEGN